MDPSDGHRNSSFSVIVLVNIAGVDANLQKEPLLSSLFKYELHLNFK